MEKLFRRPSHTKTEGREGKEEESRLFRYSQCPLRCHLQNTFSSTPNFKSWKWFANSEFTRLFRPHLMMVWYGKSEENLFTVKWLLPHISQTSFSPPSFPTTPNLYFGKWKRKISKRQSLELLLRVNRHCNCRVILKMRIKVMHLLITLTQVETRRSSEYNQADNLLHLQVHPQQINPGLLHYRFVCLLGLVTFLQALWWSTLLKIYQSTQELHVTSPVSQAKERSISDALGTYHLHPSVQVTIWLKVLKTNLNREKTERRSLDPQKYRYVPSSVCIRRRHGKFEIWSVALQGKISHSRMTFSPSRSNARV